MIAFIGGIYTNRSVIYTRKRIRKNLFTSVLGDSSKEEPDDSDSSV